MFGIPTFPKMIYPRNFINNVVVVGSYNNNRSCTAQRQSLKDRYMKLLPVQSDNPQHHYEINIDVKTNQTNVNADVDEENRQLTLRNRNMRHELTLTNTTFQYREDGAGYGTAVTFNESVRPAIDYLEEVGVGSLNVLRLRKVNAVGFRMKSTEKAVCVWQPAEHLLNPKLSLQYSAMLEAAPCIEKNINTLQFTEGAYSLTIKYGFAVLESKPDGSNVKGQIVIDLEIAKRSPITTDKITEELELMHQELYNAFRWSISDDFVNDLLNQEKAD